MASSSSCKSYVYDVFLSFCGEDTRKNFVDHLYAALDQQCICTFKDDEKLQKGRDISDDLLQSIEESRFYIIVFSKHYASSSWCLNELLKIMECHNTREHTAFPVFYDVDPSEVRKQSGLVGETLAKLNKNESEVEKWRKALTEASNLSGWDVKKTANGHEAKVVKLIVEKVSSELPPIDLNVDENLVGMEKRMKDLESYLEIGSNDVRMIGIKGMGGAGKTTLARAIFDKISFNFEGASFVENVRETTSQSGLRKLQKQILREVFKDKNITVNGVHEGKNLIKKKLHGKKVLIVLDDVDSEEQLKELAGDPNWFNPGSRVIITTRDEQVLNTYTVKWIINVTLLSDEEAIRLFSRHAFRRNNPSQEYETQSHEVVRYAAGLPLTIKVLGSSLRGKNKPEWKDTISRLKKIPLKETLKKLELSYESLEDDYKEMFLDVACFLRLWSKDKAIEVLESCGFHAINGLRVLEQKSLIRIKGKYQGGNIQMHDHIIEMGENIVRREHPDEPSKHSRLWVQEEIEHVLANDLGTEATRCIYKIINDDGIVLESLKKMKKLRCLINIDCRVFKKLSDYHVKIDEAPQYFPNSLQYLSWNGYPYRCLPKTFEANNLVTLDMRWSKIEQLWNEGRVMKKLKFLFLAFSKLKSLDIGQMPNLERLNLEYCSYLEKLYVHGGCLKSLVYLNLSRCHKLKSLDLGMMPNLERLNLKLCSDLVKLYVHGKCLKSLVYLNLSGCITLKSPLFIEHLESLEVLYLDGWNLKEFPNYITTGKSNNSLLELDISGGYKMEEVPSWIGYLHNLVSLRINNRAILKIPWGSICGLQHLRTLDLKSTHIEELSDDIGQLECLENLALSNASFKHLPVSICKLKHLTTLILHCCMLLEKLPDDVGQLKSLENLDLTDCYELRYIPSSICKLKHLKYLNLSGCRRLDKLPDDMGDLQCLKSLYIKKSGITHLPPNISLLKGLKIVKTEVKRSEVKDDDFIQLCFKFVSKKPQIQGFQQLITLHLGRCRIEKVPEAVGHLELLEELNLSYTDVKHLPNSICMLKHLKFFILQRCVLLEKLPDNIGELESLVGLYLSRCYSIREIPNNISMLKQLKILDLWHCFCLEKLPKDIGQLENLEELYITRCYNIRQIPNHISLLKNLRKLELEGCKRLQMSHELEDYIFYILKNNSRLVGTSTKGTSYINHTISPIHEETDRHGETSLG